MISETTIKKIAEEAEKYPQRRSALLLSLYLVQGEEGYITKEGVEAIAEILGITPTEVWSVAGFYTMFNLKEVGKKYVQVCKNISCNLVGAERIIDHLSRRLGIPVGGTTADGMFTLSVVECLGSCGTGPMMQVNDDYYENLTEAKVDEILEALRKS
jgi:NADH-quinone oxidoreductase E subunit